MTDNATKYLEEMAAVVNFELLLGKANLGGCSLEKHWNLVEQCDLLPFVKPYGMYKTGNETRSVTLREALDSEPWDYVVLNHFSNLSWRQETYSPYLDRLIDLVRKHAPQAQILFHQTWAYRYDSDLLKKFGISQQEMFDSLKQACAQVTRRFGCRLIPSGEAFQKARAVLKYTVDTNYDFSDPQPLQVPDQEGSLIVGYHWKTGNTASGKPEFHLDGKHANINGYYLASAVWYEMFTGYRIFENSCRPEGISQEVLAVLKNAAHETVAEYGGPIRRHI
jgi:hypothetical protein